MKISPLALVLLSSFLGLITARAQDSAPVAPATPPASTDTATASAPDTTATPAKIDPVKEAEIRKLLELSGTVKMTNEGIKQMIEAFRQQNTSLPDSFWDKVVKEINTQELVDKTIPLYDKYYTLEDLKAMNAFYESPAGKRMLAAAPMLMHDSMVMGQEWGRGMAMKLSHEIAEEKKAAEPSSSTPDATTTPAPSGDSTGTTPAAPDVPKP